MNRRRLLTVFAVLPFASLARAAANTFDAGAFAAAQKAGKPILVMVHAQWCPTCRKQEPTVNSLLKAPEFSGVQWFKVDFDSQEDALRSFKVSKQSTLIVFRGDQEMGRSTGQTNADAIATLIRKAL